MIFLMAQKNRTTSVCACGRQCPLPTNRWGLFQEQRPLCTVCISNLPAAERLFKEFNGIPVNADVAIVLAAEKFDNSICHMPTSRNDIPCWEKLGPPARLDISLSKPIGGSKVLKGLCPRCRQARFPELDELLHKLNGTQAPPPLPQAPPPAPPSEADMVGLRRERLIKGLAKAFSGVTPEVAAKILIAAVEDLIEGNEAYHDSIR